MSISVISRNQQLVNYIASTTHRIHPPDVIDAAKRALVDFLAVAVGATGHACVKPVRATVMQWNAQGGARLFLGPQTTPSLAAFANGTMAHAMDYDDTHPGGAGHPSACCWSSALALAEHHHLPPAIALSAFITGYEVMTKLGGGYVMGVGRSLQRRGLHPTSVVGRSGAAATASVLLNLSAPQIANALGVAATTAGGLVGSFGTHGKPFHAGKAAMDGILSAELAANGFEAATHLYELGALAPDESSDTIAKEKAHRAGLLDVFIQDHAVEPLPLDFDQSYEIRTNAFKPYASCRATHPSIQAAISLSSKIKDRTIQRIVAQVHPNSLITAGRLNPQNALQGKFSLPFCIAMALSGYPMVDSDFTDEKLKDPVIMPLVPQVRLVAVEGQAPYCAHLTVHFHDGESLSAHTDIVIGHPDNPMSWQALETKFMGLTVPLLGDTKANALFKLAQSFDQLNTIPEISRLLSQAP